MSKRFLIVLAALVVVFGGFLWFSKTKSSKNSGSNSSGSQVTASNHTQGAGKKGVVLIEYGDFQCPYCGQYYTVVEQVRQKYGDDIKFQFRSFPIVQKHKNAMVAHRAAEAADKQGKFWDMYNVLYSQQQGWVDSADATKIMEGYASQLGLDINKFRQDFSSSNVNDIINADLKAGQNVGVDSTPTFFVNGKKIDPLPDRTVEAISKLIDNAIAEKAQTSSQSTQKPSQ